MSCVNKKILNCEDTFTGNLKYESGDVQLTLTQLNPLKIQFNFISEIHKNIIHIILHNMDPGMYTLCQYSWNISDSKQKSFYYD